MLVFGLRNLFKYLLALVIGHIFEHENRVIAVELLHRIDQRVGINDFEHIIAHRIIKLGKHFRVQRIADQFEKGCGKIGGKNGDYLVAISAS